MDSKPHVDFLADPDNIHYQIICFSCSNPLWEAKVLKRHGDKVISTETKSCNPRVPSFNQRLVFCPLCGNNYSSKFKGTRAYLIKDMKSGLKRLV